MEIPTNLQPSHPAYQLDAKLTALEQALVANDPLMPGHLKAVHAQLIQFPELIHLLQPEDYGKVVAAHSKYSDRVLVTAKVAKATAKRKVSIDDIM
jgi:predicted regulator of amino acid metabolism with ACT domain